MRTQCGTPVRRRHAPEQVAGILAEYERGPATQREIADRHGVSVGTIQNWLRRRERQVSASGNGWIEVVAEEAAAAGAYRIELPNGRTLVLGVGWRAGEVRELVGLLCPS